VAADGRCLQYSDRVPPMTKSHCCCTGGAAWGPKCEKCPAVGTGLAECSSYKNVMEVYISLIENFVASSSVVNSHVVTNFTFEVTFFILIQFFQDLFICLLTSDDDNTLQQWKKQQYC
jgi:TB domain